MWMASLGCGVSPPTPTLDREGRMAWNGITREKYRRGSDRYESDLTDGGVACGRAAPPGSIEAGPSPHRWSSDGFRRRRDPVHAVDGVPVARDSRVFPALATVRNHFRAWRDDGGRDRQPVGEDDGDGRPVGIRRGQEDQGREAPRRGGCGGVPGRGPGSRGRHAGPGRCAGGHPCDAGEGAEGGETVGGRRLCGTEAGGRAGGVWHWTDPWDRVQAWGNKGLHRPCRCWVVERTFAWLSWCRRLARDVERTLAGSLAWVRLAACRFLTRRLARGITP